MRQNMMMNALQEGLVAQGATSDASAAIQSFAVTRAEQQQKTAYAITGQLAARWLPIMKNVFEALFYGAFLFIFLAALLPAGVGILKTYLMSLFWLQTWAPLYAVLNLLMNIDAKMDSLAAASLQGGYALTLATASGIEQVNSDTAVLAGYLSMSIPFIAFGIIKGGVSTFTHLAGYIGGVSQASATQASEEASTGNINLGNTSMSNHSLANTSGFKHDTNAEFRTGAMTYQTASGASITTTSGGEQSIVSGAAISSLGTQVQLSESIRASAMKQSEHYTQAAQHSGQETATSLGAAYRNMYELAKHQSNTTSSGQYHSTGETSQISSELSEAKQVIDSYAKNAGVSSEQMASALGSVAAKATLPTLWKPLDVQVSAEMQGSSTARSTELLTKAQDYLKNNQLSERLDHVTRAVADKHYNTGSETGNRIVDNIASSLDKSDSFRESTNQSLQKAESFKTLASESQERAIAINSNANQEFVDWLKLQPMDGSTQPMGINNAEYLLHHQPELARGYAAQFVAEQTEGYISQYAKSQGLGDASTVTQQYHGGAEAIKQKYQGYSDQVNERISEQEIVQPNNAIARESKATLQNTQTTLQQKQHQLQETAIGNVWETAKKRIEQLTE